MDLGTHGVAHKQDPVVSKPNSEEHRSTTRTEFVAMCRKLRVLNAVQNKEALETETALQRDYQDMRN